MYCKILTIAICVFLLGGCADFKPQVGPPWMQDLLHYGPPNAPTNFKLGWHDGCETGFSATANRLQRSFYKFRQNYDLSQDPVYYAAWKSSYNYCQRYMFQWLRRNII